MRACHLFRGDVIEPVDDLATAFAAARDGGGFVWVDLDHPVLRDFEDVERIFGLHRLAVEDAVNARDRPKLDAYNGTWFCALMTVRYLGPRARLETGRVMAFGGDGFVVTVRHEDGDTVDRARRRLTADDGVAASPVRVLHALLDTIVDDCWTVSEQVEAAIIATAGRLFSPRLGDEAETLYVTTLQLLALSHAVKPLIEPLRHLSDGSSDGVDVETAHHFRDVLDHALVLSREIDDYNALVDHLRDTNDSRIALQQNTDMRKISAWAAIIAVPTAITGFYGMNVPYPGFGSVGGAVAAVVAQAVLAVALFLVFRRRGWL